MDAELLEGQASKRQLTPYHVATLALIELSLAPADGAPRSTEALLIILSLIQDIENNADRNLAYLHRQIPSKIFDGLLTQLTILCSNPDALFEFFTAMKGLTAAGSERKLDAQSKVGVFVRRQTLTYNQMSFSATARLFTQLVAYKRAYLASLNRNAPSTKATLYSPPRPQADDTTDPDLLGVHLRKMGPNLAAIRKDHVKEAYQIYLDAVSAGDYPGAVEALHRYFDLSINARQQAPVTGEEVKRKSLLPYAVLALGSLHVRMGHDREAMQAILETVRLAQSSNDSACITHALSWLHCLIGATGDTLLEERLLRRCIQRAQELNMPQIAGLSELALAQHSLTHARRVTEVVASDAGSRMEVVPMDVHSHLAKAAKLGANSGLPTLLGTMHLLRAAAFEHFSHATMSSVWAHVFLQIYDDNSDNSCLALCKVAYSMAAHGQYGEAFSALERAGVGISDYSRRRWSTAVTQLTHEWALQRGDLEWAEVYASQLESLAYQDNLQGTRDGLMARYKFAQAVAARGRYEEAVKITQELISSAQSEGHVIHGVAFQLGLAEIHVTAGSFISALPHVLVAMSLSASYALDSLHASATVTLAEVRLGMGEPAAARALVESVLPHVLEHCPAYMQGHVHLVLAKTYLAATEPSREDQERAAMGLRTAITHFLVVAAAPKLQECYRVLAHVYHALGLTAPRNRAAHALRQLVTIVPDAVSDQEDGQLTQDAVKILTRERLLLTQRRPVLEALPSGNDFAV